MLEVARCGLSLLTRLLTFAILGLFHVIKITGAMYRT